MWSLAHFDTGEQTSSRGVDSIDFVMIAPFQSQSLPVHRETAHVRTPTSGKAPLLHHLPSGEVNDRDTAFTTVGDVEHLGVTADIQAMGPLAGWEEIEHGKTLTINQVHAMRPHISHVEDLPIR